MITKDKWISVEDRLPEKDGEWYLISVSTDKTGAMVTMSFFERAGKEFLWLAHNDMDGHEDNLWSGVTHWMPMPRQPQCFEGGPDKGCSCPDHGRSLIDY